MTVSADSVKEFTRREILRRSLQKARLLNAAQNPSETSPLVQQAADALEMKLADLQAEGTPATTAELKTLDLTANTLPTDPIALPDDTLDVQGTVMLNTGASAEIPVLPMGQEEWQRMTDKTAQGSGSAPSRFYVHRLLTVSLYVWPGVPASATGWFLRYRQVRLLRGAGTGTNTMDLQRHWTTYLVYAVAHELAVDNSQDVQYCGYLRSERDRLLKRSLAKPRQGAPTQMHVTNRGPWR